MICASKCVMKIFPISAALLFIFLNTCEAAVPVQEQRCSDDWLVCEFLPDPLSIFVGPPLRSLHTPFILPAEGRVSSLFGWRNDPMGGGRRFHSGIDFSNLKNSAIRAAGSGEVAFAGWGGGCGWMAVVKQNAHESMRYCHLERVLVKAGERVATGQMIGRMGTTGRSTGPHLHFELLRDGEAVDPAGQILF